MVWGEFMAEKKTGGSKMETFLKLTLVFFISLLSFSVGTFVGKQVSDSDYRRASLEGELNIHRGTASEGGTEEASNGNALSEEEIASLTEEFIESEKNKMENEEAPATETASNDEGSDNKAHDGYTKYGETAKAKPSENVKQKVAERKAEVNEYKNKIAANTKNNAADKVANNAAASSGTVEKRNPSSVLPSVASSAIGKYTVQVASYATEDEAKSHASKLKDKGWNAFYIPAEVSGRTWFRVSVGLFNSVNSAKTFQDELSKEASISSSIIQKIVQ